MVINNSKIIIYLSRTSSDDERKHMRFAIWADCNVSKDHADTTMNIYSRFVMTRLRFIMHIIYNDVKIFNAQQFFFFFTQFLKTQFVTGKIIAYLSYVLN